MAQQITFVGRVVSHENSRPQKAAVKDREGGAIHRCVWWEGGMPPEDTDVTITGTVKIYQGRQEIHVTQCIDARPAHTRGRLQRIMSFYRECVEAEASSDLSLPPRADGHSYAVLIAGELPLLVNESGSCRIEVTQAGRQWCERQLASHAQGEVLVGWPIVVTRGKEGEHWAPLLAQSMRLVEGEGRLALHVERNDMIVNRYAMKDWLDETESALVDSELEELWQTADGPALARMSAVLERLHLLGVPVDVQGLVRDPIAPPPDAPSGRILPACLLFTASGTAYTRSLIQELASLEAMPEATLGAGPLGALLCQLPLSNSPAVGAWPIVAMTNLDQDRAVGSAMHNTVSVLTGPPGTGKSQVLVNCVAGTVEAGQTVLLASQNNQAVQVVFERIQRNCPGCVPLRTGSGKHMAELAAAVASALEMRVASATPSLQDDQAWAGIAQKLTGIHEIVTRRAALTQSLGDQRREYEERLALTGGTMRGLVDPGSAWDLAQELSIAQGNLLAARRSWWPCVRARVRSRAKALWPAYEALCAALPGRAVERLLPHPEAPTEALKIAISAQRELVLRARAIADDEATLLRLPDEATLSERLTSLNQQRKDLGTLRVRARWQRRLIDASPSVRTAAAKFRTSVDGKTKVAPAHTVMAEMLPAFPVWAVTNLSAQRTLPLRAGLFDLVVLDEASQCSIASALPLLFRAKRALIVGDKMQLAHISSLKATVEEQIAERAGLTPEICSALSYKSRSLFDAAAALTGERPMMLREHFRSVPDIVQFINTHFYQDRLIPQRSHGEVGPAVQWVDVRGAFAQRRGRSALNRPEAEQVVGVLLQQWPHWHAFGWNVGVVAPFRAQVDVIADLLRAESTEIAGQVTVDTVHKFQGDERDIIVISTTAAPGMPERSYDFAGTANLINVALSRARNLVVIVGDRSELETRGGVLGKLAEHVRNLPAQRFRSHPERLLFERLWSIGIKAEANCTEVGHELDILVRSVKLNIECDGARYHRNPDRDAIRDGHLRAAGWTVQRFAAARIIQDIDGCIHEIKQIVDRLSQESKPTSVTR